jgi:hypothetical protein
MKIVNGNMPLSTDLYFDDRVFMAKTASHCAQRLPSTQRGRFWLTD